jgi:non-specific protein-tyrosine kinase
MAAEGKTATVVNLGVTLASAGRRVILLDLDLRRPRLGSFFGMPGNVGATSVLVGDAPLAQVLREVSIGDGVPHLQVLASGPVPANPAEALGSGRLTELLGQLQATADVVIIDAPPLLPVTDALVLAGRVDGVLLVVAAEKTRRRTLGSAVELLRNAEAPVLGAVLNGASRRHHFASYGYAYSHSEAAHERGLEAADERGLGTKATAR